MDDSEYYAMMRRQYSHTDNLFKKKTAASTGAKAASENTNSASASQTPGSFNELTKKYGHEDAEMFYERNKENPENENE